MKGSCDFYFYIDDLDFSEVLNFSVKEIVLENIGTPLKLIGNVVVKTITSKIISRTLDKISIFEFLGIVITIEF